jgi:hypothetical protein
MPIRLAAITESFTRTRISMDKRELEKRKAEMTSRARAEVAKTEIVQFRLDPANILRLYELAEKNKKPLGAMVRNWVLERMAVESTSGTQASFAELPARVKLLEAQMQKLAGGHKKRTASR